MIKADQYISELLYDNDCVIVPNLGGFVCNYAPASIHPTQHIFSPPSKNIVFNRNLKNNDGLLVNFISRANGLNYNQSNEIVTAYSEFCNSELRSGKKVEIKNVGILHQDIERNVQFEPFNELNFLTDSFGLTTFQSPPIKRDNYVTRIEKQIKERDRPPIAAERVRKPFPIKRVVTLSLLLPFVGAILWVSLKTDLLQRIDFSNVNPFKTKTEVLTPTVETAKKETPVQQSTKTETVVTENTAPETTPTVVENEPLVKNEIMVDDTTHVAPPVTVQAYPELKNHYHVVVGCFQIYENAVKYIAQLKEQNLSASIIGQTRTGLHIVSVGSYANWNKAITEMKAVKGSQPAAWVLTY